GSESHPPMLNKENYVPWSSRLLRYAKSRPNGKLIHKSILNGPYVRKMIPELGDATRDITVTKTFHLQIDDELSDKELKQIEADDQLFRLSFLEKKAKLFNEWERFTSNEGESIESYYHRFLKLMNDLKRNKHFPKKIASYSECCLESKGSECWKSEWFNWCSREWKSKLDWEWGVGHYARNCTVRSRRRDAAYLQTQLLIT
nr:hypothetical protein [Tanacetum cinerariifolium]